MFVFATTPEEALAHAAQLGSHLFTHQFLVVFDAEQRCCYASPGAAQVLGYPAAHLTPDVLHAATHPDDRLLVRRAAGLAQEFDQFLRHRPAPADGDGGPPPTCFSTDYRLRHQAGPYRRVLCQTFGLAPDAAGRPRLTGQLFTDITGHKTSCDVRFSICHPDFTAWVHSRKAARTSDPLSAREQEILVRMLAGETNATLSKELFISDLTLKTHRRNIHRKMKSAAEVGPPLAWARRPVAEPLGSR